MMYLINSTMLNKIAHLVPEHKRDDLWTIYREIQDHPATGTRTGINTSLITPEIRQYVRSLPKGTYYAKTIRTKMHRDLGIDTEGEGFVRAFSIYLSNADNLEVIREPMASRIKVMYRVI